MLKFLSTTQASDLVILVKHLSAGFTDRSETFFVAAELWFIDSGHAVATCNFINEVGINAIHWTWNRWLRVLAFIF